MIKQANNNIAKTVGPKFKDFRKKLNISLKDLAAQAGVSSKSTLSRWERGEKGLPVEVFERLITSLNISYSEIVINEVEIKQLLEKIEYLYQNNDVQQLQQLATYYLDEYAKSDRGDSRIEALFKSAVSLNYYLDLTGVDLSTDKYKSELKNRVENIQYWFKKEIILFGNVQLLLDADTVYGLARSLASDSFEKDIVSKDVSITLINAIFVLIKKKAPLKAKRLLNVTSKLNFSSNDILVKVRLRFMECLLQYIDSGNRYAVEQFINTLESEILKKDYQFAFAQVKQIYQS